MNICLISQEYPPETGGGGIGTHIYSLAHGLTEIGHTVHVISESTDKEKHEYLDKKVIVHRIPTKSIYIPFIFRKLIRTKYYLERSFAVFLFFGKLIQREKIHIVECYEWRAEGFFLTLFKPQNLKIIIKLQTPRIITDMFNSIKPNLDSRVINWLERFTILHADKVVSISRSLAEICREKMKLCDVNIDVLPNVIDTDLFSCKPLEIKQCNRTILYVGRLEKRKGVEIFKDVIPQVIKEFSDTRFVFVGLDTPTAPNRQSMKLYILENIPSHIHKNIEFAGKVDRETLLKYYSQSDICVFPSFYEGFGNICVEAMSCGRTVISSNSGGMAEIIEDGISGLLINPKDTQELVVKILHLLLNPEKIVFLADNAKKRIDLEYSKNVIIDKTIRLYEKVINS